MILQHICEFSSHHQVLCCFIFYFPEIPKNEGGKISIFSRFEGEELFCEKFSMKTYKHMYGDFPEG